jgi:hypothetical protein
MDVDAINRVPTSTIFFKIGPDLQLQLWIDCGYLAHRHTGQPQHSFSQMRGRSHDSTAFVNQSLHSLIKVKAALAAWAACQVRLHYLDFCGTEFPVDIEMETSNRFKTAHIKTVFHKLSTFSGSL